MLNNCVYLHRVFGEYTFIKHLVMVIKETQTNDCNSFSRVTKLVINVFLQNLS